MEFIYKNIAPYSLKNVILGTNLKRELMNQDNIEVILDTFIENGGVSLDTARSYCDGMSEIAIGRWLKKRRNREKIELATKAGHPKTEVQNRISKDVVLKELEISLKALRTDYIDLFWLHRDDLNISVEIIIDYLNVLKKEGKVLKFGASNWSYERIASSNEYAKKSGQSGFSCSQIQWSVGVPKQSVYLSKGMQYMNRREYEAYQKSNFLLYAYSPQAKGYFYYLEDGRNLGERQQVFDHVKNREQFVKLKAIANKYEVPLTYPILSFLTSSPLNVKPIVGCRSKEEVIVIAKAVSFSMNTEEYESLIYF